MNKRNKGIDLLRCAAMLMITVLHVLNHGGPLMLIVKALLTALAIFLACCLIDQLWRLLYRLLRIGPAIDWLANRAHADAEE